ncbi:hypothetical protein EJB05_39917, partial [Eragrostis curvula]
MTDCAGEAPSSRVAVQLEGEARYVHAPVTDNHWCLGRMLRQVRATNDVTERERALTKRGHTSTAAGPQQNVKRIGE